MDIEKIKAVIDEKISDPDYADCFVVDIEYNVGQNYLKVFLDSDSGLTLPKCKAFSRHIETFLDESLLLGEKYGLDVSSPGLDRPLKLLRQYQNNVGRFLDVDLIDGQRMSGELLDVNPQGIVLAIQKTKREMKQESIQFDQIKKSLVQIKFK